MDNLVGSFADGLRHLRVEAVRRVDLRGGLLQRRHSVDHRQRHLRLRTADLEVGERALQSAGQRGKRSGYT